MLVRVCEIIKATAVRGHLLCIGPSFQQFIYSLGVIVPISWGRETGVQRHCGMPQLVEQGPVPGERQAFRAGGALELPEFSPLLGLSTPVSWPPCALLVRGLVPARGCLLGGVVGIGDPR